MGQESFSTPPSLEEEDFNNLNEKVIGVQRELLAKWFGTDNEQLMAWLDQEGNGELLRAAVTKYIQNKKHDEDANIDTLISEIKAQSQTREESSSTY